MQQHLVFVLSWKSLSRSASAREKLNFLSVVKLTQGQIFPTNTSASQHMFLFIDTKQLFVNEIKAPCAGGEAFHYKGFVYKVRMSNFTLGHL